MVIINNLPELMARKRWNMRKLATKSGVRPNTISNLWHGIAKEITFESMSKICDALNCTPGELFAVVDKVEQQTTELPPNVSLFEEEKPVAAPAPPAPPPAPPALESSPPQPQQPEKRGRGRPAGSKDKTKRTVKAEHSDKAR